MANRKAVRKELASLFEANSNFDNVYDHAPLDLRSKNKVLCIYGDSSKHEMISRDMNNAFYRFFLETYALRRVSAADAEDNIDDMHEAVRSVIRANVGNDNWNELSLEEESEVLFAQVATEPYRVERHTLIVKVSN